MKDFLQKIVLAISIVSTAVVPFGASAGINDIFKGWSWSPTIGWVSMNSTNTGATHSYGVTLDDSRNLTGWSWSSNIGWICFGTSCPGTAPDGDSSWASLDSDVNMPQIYGWARIYSSYLANPGSEDGWISLNCKSYAPHPARNVCSTSDFKVYTTLNSSDPILALKDGQFQGYGWNCMSNDGLVCGAGNYTGGFGWIRFDPLYTPIDVDDPLGTYSGVPWVQVLYGDLYAKGDISTPSPFTSTFQQVNATYCIDTGVGSTVTRFTNDPSKCATYLSPVKVDIDLPKKGSNYSNILGHIKLRGYKADLTPIDTVALAAGKYGPWTQTSNLNSLPDILGGGVYDTVSGGDWTIGAKTLRNAGVNGNGSGLLIVRGNLTITGDILYEDTDVNDLRRLASFGILVLDDGAGHPGNITIDPSVGTISANIYAEGTVSTGSTGNPTEEDKLIGGVMQPPEKQLVINGVVAAKQFIFQRIYSHGVNQPAEKIQNDGRIVVNTPPGMNDFVASLPTVSY